MKEGHLYTLKNYCLWLQCSICFFYLHFEDTSDFHASTWWLEWHRPLWTPPTIPVEKEREQVIAPALEHNWVEKGTKKVPQRTTTLFVGS